MKRVCLFGLSANPPTGNGGHVGIVKALSALPLHPQQENSREKFDEIRVLPVYRHMFASKRGKQASYDDRLEMCKLAFQDIPRVIVSDDERICFHKIANEKGIVNQEEMNKLRVGTAELLEMLMEQEPMTEFSFALGQDTFMDLTTFKWRRTRDIFSLLNARLVVFHRKQQQESDHEDACDVLQQRICHIAKELKEVCPTLEENLTIVHVKLSSISSTKVRETTDESFLQEALHPHVLQYIKDKQLYAFSQNIN
ncbi:hypothetical protein CTEN210_17962 [Chaetoceros tenuissimus]|uniref:Cytidyltransferase-like domain-containing protein n=1 Tax=Chaetoceros tenuissimus TaxID=426638 RepID=A0AAD3HFK9_9STRA|nr:hypothetical protein CTEN210_17962 [Chaetoceros tenuissimus]